MLLTYCLPKSIQGMKTHYSLEEILLKQKIWENILMVIEDRFIFAFFSWKFSFYFKISMKNARIIFTFIWEFFSIRLSLLKTTTYWFSWFCYKKPLLSRKLCYVKQIDDILSHSNKLEFSLFNVDETQPTILHLLTVVEWGDVVLGIVIPSVI